MTTLLKTGTKIISANAVRQAHYAEKMRSHGKKKLTLWVTPEEERKIRFLLSKQEDG